MRAATAAARMERIAVFRALKLGDMLCAVPAFRALRRHYPRAEISWIGLPEMAHFARRFRHYIDRFIPFCGHVQLPERYASEETFAAFANAHRNTFDLVIQMHGDGRVSNAIVASFAEERMLALRGPQTPAVAAGLYVPYRNGVPEAQQLLQLLEPLGIEPDGDDLEWPVWGEERLEAAALMQSFFSPGAPYVCVHPGASVAARRWSTSSFAAVSDHLAGHGLRVVLTGDTSDVDTVRAVRKQMRTQAVDVCGRTSLGALATLLTHARLVVTNDTATSHLARAVRVPSITVVTASDPARWAAPTSERHRTLHAEVPCRPCSHRDCPIGHPCATELSVARVTQLIDTCLAGVRDAA